MRLKIICLLNVLINFEKFLLSLGLRVDGCLNVRYILQQLCILCIWGKTSEEIDGFIMQCVYQWWLWWRGDENSLGEGKDNVPEMCSTFSDCCTINIFIYIYRLLGSFSRYCCCTSVYSLQCGGKMFILQFCLFHAK